MSRATSGLAISFDSSAIRFSSSDISASIVSGARGLLIILTREDPLPDAVEDALSFRCRDPSGDEVRRASDRCPSSDLPDAVEADFMPRVDATADRDFDLSSSASPFTRAARQSWYPV